MLSRTPSISVVIPLFNKEPDVSRSLASVLAQSFDDFECIVVNDGSTDNGPEIVRAIDDPRVRLIDQENGGVSAARNRGIQEARSGLIAFLDADDEWQPDFLETIMRLHANHPECAVFATNYFFRDVNGTLRQPIYRGGMPSGHWEGELNNYFEIASQSDPPLWSSAIAAKREALKAIGGFPVGVTSGEDLLTWARLAFRYQIAYCNVPKVHFWTPNNLSMRRGRVPDEPDVVGAELMHLLQKTTSQNKLKISNYLSFWKRMRGVVYLKQGNRKKALLDIKSAIHYGTPTLRLRVLQTLANMPMGDAIFRILLHYYEKSQRRNNIYPQ